MILQEGIGDPGRKHPEVNACNFRGEQQNAWGPAYVERPSVGGGEMKPQRRITSGRFEPIWSASGVQPPTTWSTIRTFLHGKINPKDWQVASPLGDAGFLPSFRVVSSDYGKPRTSPNTEIPCQNNVPMVIQVIKVGKVKCDESCFFAKNQLISAEVIPLLHQGAPH